MKSINSCIINNFHDTSINAIATWNLKTRHNASGTPSEVESREI